MGKSLNGKELGKGITQRKSDGLYQGRYVNRFGKTRTIYAKILNELRRNLRNEQYEDEKGINIITTEITLNEWFDTWMNTCKKNCRSTSRELYTAHYKRIKEELGWRKLTSLNLIILQNAINQLNTDNERRNSKMILVNMLDKAIAANLLTKNVAKQINTTISKEERKEKRVLTIQEAETFLTYAKGTLYYNLFVLALETGMRVGELCGLMWSDIDFNKKVLYVQRTLCYFGKGGKYIFEIHDTKTMNGRRTIPLTSKAILALKVQMMQKQEIMFKGKAAPEEYKNLVFVTRTNQPTHQSAIRQSMNRIIRNIQKDNTGFEPLTPHTFRHTFATRAIERSINPKTLQKLLGHSNLRMTMDLYCHVTENTLFEEMLKMERDCV